MPGDERSLDLVSLGEPLLRLSPPAHQQLRRATTLDVMVAGSQMNVAANLAHLGWRTQLLTKLPNHALGQLVVDECRAHGVDISRIQMVDGAKLGVTYVEFSAPPRAPLAIYDRIGSAAGTIGPDDFDWEAILPEARLAYTDGIFPGLSPSCRAASLAFLRAAKAADCTTAFDSNYRSHLWIPEVAARAWTEMLPLTDIVVTNRNVAERVFGFHGCDEELLQQYRQRFGCRVVCLTRRETTGAWSSLALAEGRFHAGERREFSMIDRYGTGDAWMAGFIYGYAEAGVPAGLACGGALVALAHTIPGDVATVTRDQLRAAFEGKTWNDVQR